MMENFGLSEDVHVIFTRIMRSDQFTHKLYLATQEMQELFDRQTDLSFVYKCQDFWIPGFRNA